MKIWTSEKYKKILYGVLSSQCHATICGEPTFVFRLPDTEEIP